MHAHHTVATNKGNEMLQYYHCGVYGSKTTGKWSCCDQRGKDAQGCTPAATQPRKVSVVSQTSVRSDDTLKSDSPGSSVRHSSSCSSGMSNYSS